MPKSERYEEDGMFFTVTNEDDLGDVFTGYAFRSEWLQLVSGGVLNAQYERHYHIDWESVAETQEEVMQYVRQWHAEDDGSIVLITATVEPVASMVVPDCDELSHPAQQSIFV